MRSKRNIMLAVSIFMAFTLALFLPGLSVAGDLVPSEPPGPTMHTLDEIYGLILYKQQGVPKTGQTKCYDTDGNEIPCAGTGQDGEIQAGVACPTPRFTDNGDGTVTDNLTKLMWTKNAQQIPGLLDWSHALNECNGLFLANHNDWRLPNVRELQSLVDYDIYEPALPTGHPFSNVQLGSYWSSTTCIGWKSSAWLVYMIGSGDVFTTSKADYFYVWCVRAGL